jgi:hypothetical protein
VFSNIYALTCQSFKEGNGVGELQHLLDLFACFPCKQTNFLTSSVLKSGITVSRTLSYTENVPKP